MDRPLPRLALRSFAGSRDGRPIQRGTAQVAVCKEGSLDFGQATGEEQTLKSSKQIQAVFVGEFSHDRPQE